MIYRLTVTFSNADRQLLEWLQDKLGGSIYDDRVENTHRLQLGGDASLKLINAVEPYAVSKVDQIEIARKFLSTFGGPTGKRLTKEVLDKREKCYWDMRHAKRKHTRPLGVKSYRTIDRMPETVIET